MNRLSPKRQRAARTALLDTLLTAAGDRAARAYASSTLGITLPDIGHSPELVSDLRGLLGLLSDEPANDATWNSAVMTFTMRHAEELDRIYRDGYEAHRRRFFEDFVFPMFPRKRVGRVLDLGCGRGWVARWLLEWLDCRELLASDSVDFGVSWQKAASGREARLRFVHVPIDKQTAWLAAQEPFDAVFLSWVLHHSSPQEASCTLSALRPALADAGHVVVLEDAATRGSTPLQDHADLFRKWRSLGAAGDDPSPSQFAAQVLLDYVAVRLLAGYSLVDMDFHYRTSTGWDRLFQEHGFARVGARFIGFPCFRDIAVPQSVRVYRKSQ